jgi:hypothetical protein
MTDKFTNYDHLIPLVDETTSTLKLQLIIGQVLPAHMHNLLMHVIAKAEQIGEERGKNTRSRR